MQVDIADAAQHIYSGPCFSLIAPAALGEVCILPRHTAFVCRLNAGIIRVLTASDDKLVFYVSGGYLEVQNSTVSVLADRMLRTDEIDREAALAAKAKAVRTLQSSPIDSERNRAKLALARAEAQLSVLEHLKHAKPGHLQR
jgi:F-type H+-transporting ATPase subunit epsilon